MHVHLQRVAHTLNSLNSLNLQHPHIMILPGSHAFRLGILRNLTSEALQIQPCGIDLTLRRVLRVRQSGIIDLDNAMRRSAETEELAFPVSASGSEGGILASL